MSTGAVLPFLQVGTGVRPLDVPPAEVFFGGGVRVGVDLGRVAPFVGGTVTASDVDAVDADLGIRPVVGSASAGLSIDLATPDAPCTPRIAVGGLVGSGSVTVIDASDGNQVHLGSNLLAGGLAGLAVDARVAGALSLGVEVGVAHVRGRVEVTETDDGDAWSATGAMTFGYADVHLRFDFGRVL